jgi:hypothetical protein
MNNRETAETLATWTAGVQWSLNGLMHDRERAGQLDSQLAGIMRDVYESLQHAGELLMNVRMGVQSITDPLFLKAQMRDGTTRYFSVGVLARGAHPTILGGDSPQWPDLVALSVVSGDEFQRFAGTDDTLAIFIN